jgi:predicted ribosomally synthesized peptide with SipW-like signal peptide
MAKRNKRIISLAVCALALAAGLSVKPAMAYFTDYTTAGGTVKISIADPSTDLTESVSDFTKRITITNTGEADCFIRVVAIAPEGYRLEMENDSEGGWSHDSDGYYYYNKPVAPGGETTVLNIRISGYEQITSQTPGQEVLPSDFNVIILQESTKVLYDKDGSAYPADWTLESGTGSNSQEGGQ